MKTENRNRIRGLRATLTVPFAVAVAMMFAPAPASAAANADAQQDEPGEYRNLTVSVRDRQGRPVTGAEVLVGIKGAEELLPLDMNGKRVFRVTDGDAIILATSSRLFDLPVEGLDSMQVMFRNRNRVGVVLSESGVNRDVNVGFGTVSNRRRTTAVGSLDTEDTGNFIDLKSYIAGRIAGVTIQGDQIIVRGLNSMTNDNGALVVVDGATMPSFAFVNENIRPADVANISVLKDSSAAIYGTQGANGVLLITTKGASGN